MTHGLEGALRDSDGPERGVYLSAQALGEADVVDAVTERVRGRAYVAMDVLDDLADLETRCANGSRGSEQPETCHGERGTFARTS